MTTRLGVVGHVGYEGLEEILAFLAREAPAMGYSLAYEGELADAAPKGATRLGHPSQIDTLLTLGGDGTLIRAARFLGGADVPIFGVNLGKLGFLTTCQGEEFPEAFRRFAADEHVVQARMALEARTWTPSGALGIQVRALNDVVVHKGGYARVLRMRLAAGDEPIANLAADGVVIATPTGSTAYSLSAGGPVVVPTLHSLIVTPVAAHTLAIRPTIFPPDITLRVTMDDEQDEVLLTADGQVGIAIPPGHLLTVQRSPRPVKLVRFADVTFFKRLRHKLGWGGPPARDG
ncbi:MAG: NAD(+) kinase [Gemmatimonas sp.]|nr:NAD(+) kinase [Gemmatimonas sp.]